MTFNFNFLTFFFSECGTPTATTGYSLGTYGTTNYESTVTVTCDTNGYQGAGTTITCQYDRSWSSLTGCQRKGKIQFVKELGVRENSLEIFNHSKSFPLSLVS